MRGRLHGCKLSPGDDESERGREREKWTQNPPTTSLVRGWLAGWKKGGKKENDSEKRTLPSCLSSSACCCCVETASQTRCGSGTVPSSNCESRNIPPGDDSIPDPVPRNAQERQGKDRVPHGISSTKLYLGPEPKKEKQRQRRTETAR